MEPIERSPEQEAYMRELDRMYRELVDRQGKDPNAPSHLSDKKVRYLNLLRARACASPVEWKLTHD